LEETSVLDSMYIRKKREMMAV